MSCLAFLCGPLLAPYPIDHPTNLWKITLRSSLKDLCRSTPTSLPKCLLLLPCSALRARSPWKPKLPALHLKGQLVNWPFVVLPVTRYQMGPLLRIFPRL